MSKICGKVTTPVVDNSPEECDGKYTDFKCVVATERLEYDGSRTGKRLNEVLADILNVIKVQDRLISKLRRDLIRIENRQ